MHKYLAGLCIFCCLLGCLFPQRIIDFLREREPPRFQVELLAPLIEEGSVPDFPIPDLSFALNQPYFYLGHGNEAVAFASQDGKFVLKFFLVKRLQGAKRFALPNIIHKLFPAYREAKRLSRQEMHREMFIATMRNYAAVFQEMRDEAGLIALHLTSKESALPEVTLVDWEGQSHSLPLDRFAFVLQHKALLVEQKFSSLQSSEEKRTALQALEDLLILRAQKGFTDLRKGRTLETNFGFCGERAVQFDVGGVIFSEELRRSPGQEEQSMKDFVRTWAEKKRLIAR